ncbi:hypothetical protein FRC02_007016, partial [Tulasnella sp. 418]
RYIVSKKRPTNIGDLVSPQGNLMELDSSESASNAKLTRKRGVRFRSTPPSSEDEYDADGRRILHPSVTLTANPVPEDWRKRGKVIRHGQTRIDSFFSKKSPQSGPSQGGDEQS